MFVCEFYVRFLLVFKDKFIKKLNNIYVKYGWKIKWFVEFKYGGDLNVWIFERDINFVDFICYLIDINCKGGWFNEYWW